ncbi:hypothetical protein [Silvimonas iriomotensis]|uniref:hypothetical protein n=1 Tax=Silvimonas iriomotensis TaxID=449662 RepID=UPI001665FEE5|nr:hypothetical protein [Silvimonas iriomotensis]
MWRMLLLTFCLLVSGFAPAQPRIAPAHAVPMIQAADPCSHCHDAAPPAAPEHHATSSPCCDNTFCSMTPGALTSPALTAPLWSGTAVRQSSLLLVRVSWYIAPPLPPPRTLV